MNNLFKKITIMGIVALAVGITLGIAAAESTIIIEQLNPEKLPPLYLPGEFFQIN